MQLDYARPYLAMPAQYVRVCARLRQAALEKWVMGNVFLQTRVGVRGVCWEAPVKSRNVSQRARFVLSFGQITCSCQQMNQSEFGFALEKLYSEPHKHGQERLVLTLKFAR